MQKFGFYIGVFLAIMVVPFFSKFSQANGKEVPTKEVVVKKKQQKNVPKNELVHQEAAYLD